MPVTIADIKKHTNADKTLCLLKNYIQFGFHVNMDSNLTQFKHVASDLSIMKGFIVYGNRVFIPVNLRQKTLTVFHDGHPGICALNSLARALIWYPGMDKDITDIVKSCEQ